jgi:RimJ/RimL family protein N-acetyltransferase
MESNHLKKSENINSNQLFLNLYLREYSNWYYFNIVPNYDPELAAYMESQTETSFMKITLEKAELTIYYPLHYFSYCGSHVFGVKPACRKLEDRRVRVLQSEVVVQLILDDMMGSVGVVDAEKILVNIEHDYRSLLNQNARSNIKLIRAVNYPKEGNLVSVDRLFSAYGGVAQAIQLGEVVLSYAKLVNCSESHAAIVWLKAYAMCLLKAMFHFCPDENKVVSANYHQVHLQLDPFGLPLELYFTDEAQVLSSVEGQAFILNQLLTHHCFPLIRNMSLLGLHTEEELVVALNEVFDSIREKFGQRANFLNPTKVEVTCFLDQLVPLADELAYAQKFTYQHNPLVDHQYYSKALIKPQPKEILHTRYFENAELEVALRAFDIDADIPVLHEWVNLDYSKKYWQMDGPIENLEEAYIKHLGVDYSHPYIGLINREPAFTIELYWATKDEVGKYYPFQLGDYGFHMLIAPAKKKIHNYSFYALTTCMEYFFSHSKVHRMIGEADVNHEGTHNLITKVGCEFHKSLTLPYKTSNLTFCTPEQFRNATQEVIADSRKEILMNI